MTQAYSDPSRESDPHALPDLEVFYMGEKDMEPDTVWQWGDGSFREPGWYWWSCFPGCLPDSDPEGPFSSEAEALDAARG